MSYNTVIHYMDAANRRAFEFLVVENGLSEKKALVDECLEAVRKDGYSISKSALAERMGLKRNQYKDAHFVPEMKALIRMNQKAKEDYASIPREQYRLKRAIVMAVIAMMEDEVDSFNAFDTPYERIMFAKKLHKQLPISLPRGIVQKPFRRDRTDHR